MISFFWGLAAGIALALSALRFGPRIQRARITCIRPYRMAATRKKSGRATSGKGSQ